MIRSRRFGTPAALVLALVMLGGCREREPQAPESPVRPAQALPIPGTEGALPQGHPPLDGATTSGRGVTWGVPSSWIEIEPSSSMRVAQYRIDGAGGTAECVVYYFGPNQGGSAMANAERWAGQFTQPDGSPSSARMKVSDIPAATGAAHLVEVTGTYDGGMTMTDQPAKPQPGSMLLGGIVPGPDAPWFFKLTGPEATVRAERERFVALLRSVRADG